MGPVEPPEDCEWVTAENDGLILSACDSDRFVFLVVTNVSGEDLTIFEPHEPPVPIWDERRVVWEKRSVSGGLHTNGCYLMDAGQLFPTGFEWRSTLPKERFLAFARFPERRYAVPGQWRSLLFSAEESSPFVPVREFTLRVFAPRFVREHTEGDPVETPYPYDLSDEDIPHVEASIVLRVPGSVIRPTDGPSEDALAPQKVPTCP